MKGWRNPLVRGSPSGWFETDEPLMRFLRTVLAAAIVTCMGYFYTKSRSADAPAAGNDAGSGFWQGVTESLGFQRAVGDSPPEHPREYFDFDLTRPWVDDHWEQVTTGLSDTRFDGHRVALVTGADSRALAGALTYYFDAQDRLRRITFTGTTHDPRYHVAWLKETFDFRWSGQQGSTAVYTCDRTQPVRGTLRITPKLRLGGLAGASTYEIHLTLDR